MDEKECYEKNVVQIWKFFSLNEDCISHNKNKFPYKIKIAWRVIIKCVCAFNVTYRLLNGTNQVRTKKYFRNIK